MKVISRSTFLILILIIIIAPCPKLFASTVTLKYESIVLPQPNNVLQIRLSSVSELANYIKQIQSAANESFQISDVLKPTSGAIVVAIKPQYRAKFWIMSSEYQIPKSILEAFKIRFNKIRPAAVQNGPVVFAINFTINGGGKPLVTKGSTMPIPQEWSEAAKDLKGAILIPEGFLEIAWPDELINSPQSITIPDGFELQTLDVTQGAIFKPKGWFYTYFNTEQSLIWTISKENPKPDGYKTGIRIQFTPGFSKSIKKSMQETAEDIIAQKRRSSKLISECKQEQIEDFKRICIETKEIVTVAGKQDIFHILYTISWSIQKDYFVMVTFGTPYEEWDKFQDIYQQMNKFVLVGKDFWK